MGRPLPGHEPRQHADAGVFVQRHCAQFSGLGWGGTGVFGGVTDDGRHGGRHVYLIFRGRGVPKCRLGRCQDRTNVDKHIEQLRDGIPRMVFVACTKSLRFIDL